MAGALFFSLIETAKLNGLEPYAYLRYLFAQLPLGSRLSRLLDALRLSSEAIDPDLARGYNLDRCFCLRSRLPKEQLQEVVYRLQLE
jgi:hypothetical protein